jgi:DegV family protein with EDD domain
VYSITLARIVKGEEIREHFNSKKEFEQFYESVKNGALPTTAALNPTEVKEFFQDILDKNPEGDLIHISLSSGLSATYGNVCKAAEEINATLKGRKVYIIDSLIATAGMDMLVDEAIKLRDADTTTDAAIARIIHYRDHLQGWIVVSDLFHLKRGGRMSGAKATIGTILNIKPIITVNTKGKLALENKKKGIKQAFAYFMEKIEENGAKVNPNFEKEVTLYMSRSGDGAAYEELKALIIAKYPTLKIQESMLAPIIGAHVGCGAVIIGFEGAKRSDIDAK